MISDNNINEGLKEVFVSLVSFIGILCYGGNIDKADVLSQLNSSTGKVVALNDIDNAIKANDKSGDVGRFTKAQAINIIARTLWMEMRGLGKKAISSCASIIWNRSDSAEDVVEKCIENGNVNGKTVYQFAVWKDLDAKSFTKANYKIRQGSNLINQKGKVETVDMDIWKFCVDTATQMIDGTFVPVHNYNLYKNEKLDSSSAKKSWGVTCTSKVDGDSVHWYGYDRSQEGKLSNTHKDRAERKSKMTVQDYTVVANDNPSVIAKKHNMTVKDFMELNPRINAKNMKIGQTVKILSDKPKTKTSEEKTTYTVMASDTSYSISRKFGMSLKEFLNLNPNINPSSLKIGQKVKIINKKK